MANPVGRIDRRNLGVDDGNGQLGWEAAHRQGEVGDAVLHVESGMKKGEAPLASPTCAAFSDYGV